jgi:2-hydroxychromene-2-carboxylate isomerase
MPARSFAVTFDYRCPFARTAHEHVVAALRAGADWEVRFVPFSLGQAHVAEGETDVWDEPSKDTGLLALQAGVVVRDLHPDKFYDTHIQLFAARHDEGRHIREAEVIEDVLRASGVDADAVFAEIASGGPLDTIRKEHEAAVTEHRVWGVPTFIADDLTGESQSVFVRLMDRPNGDADLATKTVDRVVDLVTGWPGLNEFKHTSIPR